MSTTTVIHDQKYLCLGWEDVGSEVFHLAQQILQTGCKINRVVALAKGGLTFSRTLVDYLGVKELSSIQIEFYTGVETTQKTPIITQSLPISIRNERILIFDEVVDTGETMKVAVEYLKYHSCQNIQTATLTVKPQSTFAVDFAGLSTDAWILFPHENRESIELLQKMWTKKGDSPEKIHKQLLQTGLPKEEVEFFLNFK